MPEQHDNNKGISRQQEGGAKQHPTSLYLNVPPFLPEWHATRDLKNKCLVGTRT